MTQEDDFAPGARQESQRPQDAAGVPLTGEGRPPAIADYLRFLWRRRIFIVGGTVLCGLAALLASLTAPPVYEARATLIVQPPLIAGEISSPPLSVETYRALAESDFIVDQSRIEMAGRKIIPSNVTHEAIKRRLWVATYKDSKDTPLLDLYASANSGEGASGAANTWAEVFLREMGELAKQRMQRSARTLEAQYPAIRAAVADAEAKLKARQDYWDREALDLDRNGNRKLTEFARETERLCLDHQKETARLRLEFEARWDVDLLGKRLAAQKASLLDLEKQLLDAQVRIKTKRDLLARIKEEVQSEPRYLVLSKAITDEALWERIGNPGSNLPEALSQIRLRSELMNPVHQELLSRLTAAQLEVEELDRKLGYLPEEIERLRQETDSLRGLLGAKENELSALTKDRELELNDLRAERDEQLVALRKAHEQEMGQLQRSRNLEVEALGREALTTKTAYSALAAKHQSAQLARMEEESHVRIGASAIAPQWPSRPRTALNVATALVVGLILSMLFALLVEHVQLAPRALGSRTTSPDGRSSEVRSGSEPSARHPDG